MINRILTILIFACFCCFYAGATLYPVTPVHVYTPAGGTAPTVKLSTYTITAGANPSASEVDVVKRGVLTLGIDQHYMRITGEFDLTVDVTITPYTTVSGSAGTPITTSLSISYKPGTGISYNDKQLYEIDGALKYSVYVSNITYTPVGSSASSPTTLPANVYLDLELFVDRLHDFAGEVDNTVSIFNFNESIHLIDKDCDNVDDALKVEWSPLSGAEEYELEWTFINDYTATSLFKDDEDILFDFRHNSTRIVTSSLSYEIPLIYPHGYIVYRVRAVGRLKDKPTKRVFTQWSTPDAGNVQDDANDFYKNEVEWEVAMNWQYTSTFAEEGKKKEVVSFFDGSLRSRQMVTLTNTNNKAIVGETIYDDLGRPAIQVLPAPVLSNACMSNGRGSLKYYDNFNRNSSGNSYSSINFGQDTITTCETGAQPMSTASGASKYYSANRSDLSGIKNYIPDAGGYPFSQVEYMADNTGRIKQQGGVGRAFQLDSTHATKYFYGHPSQLELDRMFGSEVGDYIHYQKNMVIDPNGQVSVSYLDQEGRVIATALAGDVPENVAALTAYSTALANLDEDYITAGTQGNSLNADQTSRSFVSSILVSSQTNMTIEYGLEVAPYSDPCFAEGICFGCVYDLTIDFVNDCGESMLLVSEKQDKKMTGHFNPGTPVTFVTDCTESEVRNGDLTLTLLGVPAGSYQLVKTLTINEEALDFYTEQYQDTNVNTCFKTLEDFQLEYLDNVDLSGCNPDPSDCEACVEALGDSLSFVANGGTMNDWLYLKQQCLLPCQPLSLSGMYLNLLVADVSPNGQYGEYLDGTEIHPENFPLSVYNPNTQLPGYLGVTGATKFWQKPKYIKNGTVYNKYYEENLLTEATVELSGVVITAGAITSCTPAIVNGGSSYFSQDPNTGVYLTSPENLLNVEDFIANFQPSWAQSLICYHPEYSYYKTYAELGEPDANGKSSDWFDDLMAGADTWQQAIAAGLIKSNYASISTPADRVYDFNNPASAMYDPFAASGDWTTYATDVEAYQGYHLAQVAAMMTRCNTIGTSPSGTGCLLFGANANGVGVGDTSAVNRAARDADWQNFKSIYRSLKQQYIASLAQTRALSDNSYYGYNGCIGNQDFNPFLNDFFDPVFGSSQFLNSEQPCYAATATLYKYKARRFSPPVPTTGINPYDAFNETAQTQYEITGQCPAFVSIQTMIGALNGADKLDGTGLHLNADANAGYTSFLLSQNLVTYPSITAPDYTWNTTTSGADLDIDIKNGAAVIEEIRLTQPGTPMSWDDILSIFNYQSTGTGGLGYTFTADFTYHVNDTVIDTLVLGGSTSIDIASCSFAASPCQLTGIGGTINYLMAALNDSIRLATPLKIYGSGSLPVYSSLVTGELLNTLNPVTSPSSVYWRYVSASNRYEMYGSGTSDTIRLAVTSVTPSGYTGYSSVISFPEVEVVDENTMILHGFTSHGNDTVQITLDASVCNGSCELLAIGDCGEESFGCTDQAVVNVGELKALLNDVLVNQGPDYDLFESPYMTANLAAQFEFGLTSTSSGSSDTYDDGYETGTSLVLSEDITTAGDVVTTVTTYTTVGESYIYTCEGRVVYNSATMDTLSTSLDCDSVQRSQGKVTQTDIHIGDCDLSLAFPENPVSGNLITMVTEVIDLIPSGEPTVEGNYYGFDLVVRFSSSDTDTIAGVSCLPLRLCTELEPFNPHLDSTTVVAVTDPCIEFAITTALANAGNAYNNYLDSLLTEFRGNYLAHCFSGLEQLSRSYQQREFHHTLYYYDQAGNLIKTVPPEGVELLPITSSSDALALAISEDRTHGTHDVLTTHRMATNYVYNSLNQLVAQHMPDMDDMTLWNQQTTNGLDVNLVTTAVQMLSDQIGYLSGYVSASTAPGGTRGYLYRTMDGGDNWSRVTDLINFDLMDIEMASNTVGFAVGKSGLALRSVNSGSTWEMLNIDSLGLISDFVDVAVEGTTAAAFLMRDGRIVRYNSGALSLVTPVHPSSYTLKNGNQITYNGSSAVYSVNEDFLVGTAPDTIRFSQMATVNISTATPTLSIETTSGVKWNAIDYLSATSGFVGGIDGDIAWLNESNSGGTGDQYHQSGNLAGEIYDLAFLNKSNGVALINDAGSKYFYRTTDGGKNWSKVISTAAQSMAVVRRDASALNVIVSYDNSKVIHYSLTTSAINTVWSSAASGGPFVAMAVNDSTNAGTFQFIGLESGNALRISKTFSYTATASPVVYTYSTGFSVSGTVYAMKAYQNGNAKHVLISKGGTVTDVCRVSSTTSIVNLNPASTSFTGIAVGTNGGKYVLAYDHTSRKVMRAALGTAAPSSGSLAHLNASVSAMPSGVTMTAMALHNDYVTMSGTDGRIYSSTTQVTSTSAANLTWVNRTEIRLAPIKAVKRFTYTNNSVSYNAIAVGHYGVVLHRTSTVWAVAPLGIVTQGLTVFNYNSVDAETQNSEGIAVLAGQGDILHRVKLSSFNVQKILTNTLGLTTSIDFRDVELISVPNTFPNPPTEMAHAVAANGIIYSTTSPNPAGQMYMTTTYTAGEELNAISAAPNTTIHWAAGAKSSIFYGSGSSFTRNYSVFGPRLNDVHFASTTVGTVVGERFFVRTIGNAASPTLWTRVLPATVNAANLTLNVTDVATKLTVSPATVGVNYCLLGGNAFLWRAYAGTAVSAISESGTVSDIAFANTATQVIWTAQSGANFTYKKSNLSASAGNGYNVAAASLITTSGTTVNAIHVFPNDDVLAVGNSYVGYLAPSGSSFTSTGMGTGLPGGTYTDVVFTDATNGYLVGRNGIFYQTTAVSLSNTSPNPVTAISWQPRSVIDEEITATTQADLYAIDMYSATHGVWGGKYNTTPSGTYHAAVRTFDVENSLYSARFYYDRLGRIVVSQNSRQKGENKYSYTLYDGLGRVTEAGEKSENASGAQFKSIFGTDVGGQYVASVIDDAKLNTWITTTATATLKEVTHSYYDRTNANISGNGFGSYQTLNKQTQRKRIVHVTYEAVYDGSEATYDHATHYDYDIHGNVVTLVQDNKLLGALTSLNDQRFKKLEYVFDLISGNVHRVDYQTGKADQWHHAYEYDADNRITDAYTTTATPMFQAKYGMAQVRAEATTTPYWEREAAYSYYDHGPLAKTIIGEQEVQGLDFVYTLQGWIKGVNSNTLDVTRDPGQDASTGSAVAKDVMGYSLHYYTGDYAPIGGSSSFIAAQTGSDLANTAYSKDMFNGNIARMVTTITDPNSRTVLPMGNTYQYDQLNRLLTSRSFDNITISTNSWGTGGTVRYLNQFTYDANGNIKTQLRKDYSGTNAIDDLTYKYEEVSSEKVRNRLYHVDDNTSAGTYTDDIDDMGTFVTGTNINTSNNYAYDAEGRLIKDVQESIASIEWRVDGKVKAINRPSGSSKKNVKFEYDAMGHRIAKHVLSSANVLEKSTYYVLDAQGNVMSTYVREIVSSTVYYSQKEKYIYGSSRLGVMNDSIPLYGSQNNSYSQTTWTHGIGKRNYELSNHLGNVLSVISDKPILHGTGGATTAGTVVDYFMADILQSTDYSAFGVQLSGRTLTKSVGGLRKSRFGYQGSEMDNEVKNGEGNSYTTEFRQLDPRLGRWLTIDPLAGQFPYQSPYCAMDNSPVLLNDSKGLSATDWVGKYGSNGDGTKTLHWQWTDASYSSEQEAKDAGWDTWQGKSGSLSGVNYRGKTRDVLLNSDASIYVLAPEAVFDGGGPGAQTQAATSGTEAPYSSANYKFEMIFDYHTVDMQMRQLKDDIRFRNTCRALDNLALYTLGGATALMTGGVLLFEGGGALALNYARQYASSYGQNFMNGGWKSMVMEFTSQTATQIVQGKWSPGNYDLLGLVTSGALGGKYGGLKWQMVQGASGSVATYSINAGFQSPLLQKSNDYTIATTAISVLSPMMGKVPLIKGTKGEVFNEILTGYLQGIQEITHP